MCSLWLLFLLFGEYSLESMLIPVIFYETVFYYPMNCDDEIEICLSDSMSRVQSEGARNLICHYLVIISQKDDSISYNPIDNETWEDHFNKLYQKSSNVEEVITDSTNSVSYLIHEEVAIDKILNHRITKSEVKKAIKKT